MAQKNRKTLKHYFQNGAMPTEESFNDLIDSFLNIKDEGFDRSPEFGIKVSTLGVSEKLMSFLKGVEAHESQWSIELHDDNTLMIKRDKDKAENYNDLAAETFRRESEIESSSIKSPDERTRKYSGELLTFSPKGRIGINQPIPEGTLDVNGTIISSGRSGKAGDEVIPADGRWHTLIDALKGCHCFEIMAGVGKERTGKYALMHAFATNVFNDKKKITYHQAYFYNNCNKIKLRWKGSREYYRLEMKTNCDYGENIIIQYSITKLWFDEMMKKCVRR